MLVPDPNLYPNRQETSRSPGSLTDGAGFALANHDLEIRGAGELLGEGQSGVIEEIGFSMYTDYLNRAIRDLSGEPTESSLKLDSVCDVDLDASAFIPDDYIPDVHTRLVIYQRIADCEDSAALYDLKLELVDRFGLLPIETKMLFQITGVRIKGEAAGIKKLRYSARAGRVSFHPDATVSAPRFASLLAEHSDLFSMNGPLELALPAGLEDPVRAILKWLLDTLDESNEIKPLPSEIKDNLANDS